MADLLRIIMLASFVLLLPCLSVTAWASSPSQVLVFTGGQADQWRFVDTNHFGEHLIFGPRQLNAARVYYYKGLSDYQNRVPRALEPYEDAEVQVIDLDRGQPNVSFDDVDLLVLDDVRAAAFEKYQKAAAEYVEQGGALLVLAGQSMLGGEELQADELPTIPLPLLTDPLHDYTPYERQPWTKYVTESSWEGTPLQQKLPVELISQPDLVVYDRQAPAVGGRVLKVGSTKPDSFASAIPLHALKLMGFHKVKAASDAEVLATIGPDDDPLIIRRGNVIVFTGHEMEAAVRLNGQPSNASINTPKIGQEVALPPWSKDLILASVSSLVGGKVATLHSLTDIDAGQTHTARVSPLGKDAKLTIEPIGDDAWLRPVGMSMPVSESLVRMPTAELPEGDYAMRYTTWVDGQLLIASQPVTVAANETVYIDPLERWTVRAGEGGVLKATIHSERAHAKPQVDAMLFDLTGRRVAQSTQSLDAITPDGKTTVTVELGSALPIGDYALQLTLTDQGQMLRRVMQPVAVVPDRHTPDMFVMIAGNDPSHYVFRDLRAKGAVMTAQTPSLANMLPYLEQHGGIPRAYGFQYPNLSDDDKFKDWQGNTVGFFSWADPDYQQAWLKKLDHLGDLLMDFKGHPVVLFDDEPKLPMKGGWEAADQFKAQTGLDAPTPQRRFDDTAYLDLWTQWEDFRVGIWQSHYTMGTEAIKANNPELRTAVVVEGMGKDIYAGFDPARSQAGVDIYWYHIYPLNEPMLMVAHALERGLSAMRAMGMDKPTWALLQNWANQADVPRVPSPAYLRAQYWMAIAHGAETVGFWPYTYGFWISPGSPGWQEVGRIQNQQQWLWPLLEQLEPVRKPIALLHSTSQGGVDHLRGLTAQRPQEHASPWHNWHAAEEAYFALKSTGLPVESLEESELIATEGRLPQRALVLSRIQYLRPEARHALKQFIDRGGVVLKDQTSTIDLAQITGTSSASSDQSQVRELPVTMDRIFHMIFPAGGFEGWNRFKHRDDWRPIIEAHARAIRPILEPFADDKVQLQSDHAVQWNLKDGGEVTYLFVVNDQVVTENLQKYRDTVEGWRLTPATWKPSQVQLSVHPHAAVYDVIQASPVATTTHSRQGSQRMSWRDKLPPAGGKIYAMFKTMPAALTVKTDSAAKPGQRITLQIELLDSEGQRLAADLPITVSWQGQPVAFTALSRGKAQAHVLIDGSVTAGQHALKVTDRVTGLSDQVTVNVTTDATPLVSVK